jgi:hypothetical protein
VKNTQRFLRQVSHSVSQGKDRSLVYLIYVSLLCTTMATPGWCQSALPEFFGFYATNGGRQVALFEGKDSPGTTKTTQELYSVPRKALLSYPVPVVSSSARFLLFYQNSGDMIKSMTFHQLPFVRNVIETPDPSQASLAILSGKPMSPRVIGSPSKSLLARIPELETRILTKPVASQPQMVELVPNATLAPGLYVFDYRPAPNQGWFAVISVRSSDQEKPYCLDLVLPGGYGGMFESANSELNDVVPALGSYRYKTCVSSTATGSGVVPAASGSTGAGGSTGAAVCGSEYNGCIYAGRNAMSAMDWPTAISDFHAAANLNQTTSDPWLALARIYQRTGQNEELSKAWDKVIALSGTVAIPACLGRVSKSCERGTLSISVNAISFAINAKTVFSVPPSQVNPDSTPNDHEYGFEVGGTRYTFDFFPVGVNCAFNKSMVQCPSEGVSQQVILAQYVSQAIPKVVQGAAGR